MKKQLEEFLEVDELDLKATMFIVLATIAAFPVGYFVVFAPFGWWML